MKIISKHYEFYDCASHGDTDGLRAWVRRPRYLPGDEVPEPLRPDSRPWREWRGSLIDRGAGWGLVGLYPWTWKVPYLWAAAPRPDLRPWPAPLALFPAPEEIEDAELLDARCRAALGRPLADWTEPPRESGRWGRAALPGKWRDELLPARGWRREQPGLFLEVGTPAFLSMDGLDARSKTEPGESGYGRKSGRCVLDCCFSDLDISPLRGIMQELDPYNVYAQIENYLVAAGSSPMEEPDDKTKIIAAGFDLKSSFRKDKEDAPRRKRKRK